MRLKKPAYITIPSQLPADERDLSRIGALIESAKNEYKAAHGMADALASEQEQGDGGSASCDAAAASLESLVDVRLSGVARVLVIDPGRSAEGVLAACRAAGLVSCVAYTEDMAAEPQLALADETVCIGPVRGKGAFESNYGILSAAEVVDAQAILLVGSRLADDERFLGMAAEAGRHVWRLDGAVADASFGGTTKAWAACEHPQCASPQTSADSWMVCPKCRKVLDAAHVRANSKVCPECGHHFRMTSAERIAALLDADSFEAWEEDVIGVDPLDFPGYQEKLVAMRTRTNLSEGACCGKGRIAGMPVAIAIMDSTFFMGSMGSAVGERITRTVERATRMALPLVILTASGGARMQEGLVSLMQMAKISAAVQRHSQAGLPYFSVITDPTTGGVTASFAMQGSVIIAEPRALIGFAGRRVIQDTIRQELPKEFQTAEFALEHGLIDAIVERGRLRETLANLMALYAAGEKPASTAAADATFRAAASSALVAREDKAPSAPRGAAEVAAALAAHPSQLEFDQGARVVGAAEEGLAFGREGDQGPKRKGGILSAAARMASGVLPRPRKRLSAWEQSRLEESGRKVAALLDGPVRPSGGEGVEAGENPAWRSVQMARDTHRPTAMHYVGAMVDGFFELHGDRAFADDGAIVAGVGWMGRRAVMVVAQEKGRNLEERILRNFGCPQPEGYRKSLRLMRQAESFGLAIVCIVDTQGAFCGKEAEERGQGNAIADNLFAMAALRVPVVSVLVGEGGSGGALALALSDRVAMQEHAVYSVLSPEGFASILWKDRSRAAEAAAVMRMNAYEIFEMGIVDAVLEEGPGSASANPERAAAAVRRYVKRSLDELSALAPEDLLAARYARFRKF